MNLYYKCETISVNRVEEVLTEIAMEMRCVKQRSKGTARKCCVVVRKYSAYECLN